MTPSLFYPAHDLALANDIRHFNPPAAAIQLQHDLAALSVYWDRIHADKDRLPDDPGITDATEMPLPWGWNYDTRQILRQAGFADTLLPDDEDLHLLRQLSSRKTTIAILKKIQEDAEGKGLSSLQEVLLPHYITDIGQLESVRDSWSGRPYLIKSPWSSSGRGLCWSRIAPEEVLHKRTAAIIREMGGAIVEPEYKKVQDFAMLFYLSRSEASFVGYSVFDTDAKGTYQSGRLMSNEAMEQLLSQWVPTAQLQAVATLYRTTILPQFFRPLLHKGFAPGYIGIDMMIFQSSKGSYALHPCIEMNVRCTMGVVSRRLFDRCVADDSTGIFGITHASTAEALSHEAAQLTEQNPPKMTDGKALSGYFPLTPIEQCSRFAAYMLLTNGNRASDGVLKRG